MLEGVLAWFINNYFGEYFDVNTDQLSIVYGEGEIELENLPLKVQPFERMNLPFVIKSGFVGRLKLTLRLRSGGSLVNISQLFLLSGPRSHFDYDARREEERAQDVKQRLLEMLESKWKLFSVDNSNQDPSASYYPSYSTFLSFSTSLFANFTENLQFIVQDVHLRYEDDTLGSSSVIVFGLTIQRLSIQSADENWEPTFIDPSTNLSISRKVVDLEGFSLYWDSCPSISSINGDNASDAVTQLKDIMSQDTSSHEYFLEPVNGKAFLSRNLSPEQLESRFIPRLCVDFKFEEISFNLNVMQCEQLLTVVGELDRRQRLLKHCRWRPKCSVKENPKSWWLYAIDANIDDWRQQRKKNNWEFVLNRCRLMRKYCDVYLAMIVQPEDATREMKSLKDQVESDLSFEEIRILRQLVYDWYQECNPRQEPTSPESTSYSTWSYLQSWLPALFSPTEEEKEVEEKDKTVITHKRTVKNELPSEVMIDVRKINILLVRSIKKSKRRMKQDKKVASACFSGATIVVKSGQEVTIEGFLKSMKITNMSSSLSDSASDANTYTSDSTEIMKIGTEQESSDTSLNGVSDPKAISFTLKRSVPENLLDLDLSFLSFYYFHSPALLREVAYCVKEFKSYMTSLSDVIKTATDQAPKQEEVVVVPQPKKIKSLSHSYVKDLRVHIKIDNPLVVLPASHSFMRQWKKIMMNRRPVTSLQNPLPATFYECLAIGLEVINGSVRLVDDVEPDQPLFEANVKELHLFNVSKTREHEGNIRANVSAESYNLQKRVWEPLIESWQFNVCWDIKKEFHKTAILKSSSSETKLKVYSGETLNFNVTNTTLDMFYSLRRKWDEAVVDSAFSVFSAPTSPVIPVKKPEINCASTEWRLLMNIENLSLYGIWVSPSQVKNESLSEVQFEFQKLGVQLLRSIKISQERMKLEKKIAAAFFNGASITIKSGQEVIVEGSVKNMKIMDMSSPSSDSTSIHFNLNYPISAPTEVMKIGSDQDSSAVPVAGSTDQQKAITFVLKRTISENLLDVNLSLVSLYYFHSPALLRKLTSWTDELKSYSSSLSNAMSSIDEFAKEGQPKKERHPSSGKKSRKPYIKDLRVQCKTENPLVILPTSHSFIRGWKKWMNPKPVTVIQDPFGAKFYECLAIGLEVINGSIRLVDDVEADQPLIELNIKELYLFDISKIKDHKGNMRATVAAESYNFQKQGWEPLIEPWQFTLCWEIKNERVGKDGILLKSAAGETKRGNIEVYSGETLNFNVTNATLDMFYSLKRKWDAVVIDTLDSPLDIVALTSSPISFLSSPQKRLESTFITTEWKLLMDIQCLAFSVVNHLNEELLYTTLSSLLLEYIKTDTKHSFNCSVREVQVDNQLKQHCKEVALHPMLPKPGDPMIGQPALSISFQKGVHPHVHYFPEFQVKCKDVVLNLEEILLLKLYEFFGYPWEGTRALDRAIGHMASQAVASSISRTTSFVYCVLFEIVLKKVRLSVYTSSQLPVDLTKLKERVGLSLIAFEDAKVRLEAFKKEASLDSVSSLWSEIVGHYKKQLQRQAALILGSVDFLGNPLGLVNDVSEGISDLVERGNAKGLVRNVAHGIANSSAKFMSSLSNSLDVATVDAKHQEIRRKIQQEKKDHLRTGIRGLGVGILGGVTSIVTQTFDGAVTDGVEGMVSGFGKGLLGTVTKPAVGMLDFATGAASFVRDTTKKVNHHSYQRRKRPPRVCVGPKGLLPPYDEEQALGQQYFFESSNIRDREEDELFTSFHPVSSGVACIISTDRVRFLNWDASHRKHGSVILSLSFKDVIKCNTGQKSLAPEVTVSYIVLIAYEEVVEEDLTSSDFPSFGPSKDIIQKKRVPSAHRIQCRSDRVATGICQLINLAKSHFDQRLTTQDYCDR